MFEKQAERILDAGYQRSECSSSSTAEVDYMLVHPDDFGQRYGVRFQIIPVLPALFKGTLF